MKYETPSVAVLAVAAEVIQAGQKNSNLEDSVSGQPQISNGAYEADE